MNISLTPVDIAAIEHRNDFLHGRITELPDTNGESKKVSREVSSMEIYYISLRLYMLVSMLILKYIGYDGRIVNQPKIQQHNYTDPAVLAQLATEDYFRQI